MGYPQHLALDRNTWENMIKPTKIYKVIWSGINLQKVDSELLHSGAPLEVYTVCIPAIRKRILLHPTSNLQNFIELLWSSLRLCVLRFEKRILNSFKLVVLLILNISWMHYRYIFPLHIPLNHQVYPWSSGSQCSQQAQCSPVPPCSAPPWRDENWG